MTTHKAEIDYCRDLVRALAEANSFEDATVIVVDARNDSAQNVLNAVRREVEALKVVSDARLTKAIELADAYESVKAENERLRAERSLFLEQRDKSAAAHQETRAQLTRPRERGQVSRKDDILYRHPGYANQADLREMYDIGFAAGRTLAPKLGSFSDSAVRALLAEVLRCTGIDKRSALYLLAESVKESESK